jgi:hypothetical protein
VPHGLGQAANLERHDRLHWDRLFMFLARPEVELIGNISEPELHTSVIHDKLTGSYHVARDADHGAILTTVREQGRHVSERLSALAGASLYRPPTWQPEQLRCSR